MSKKYLILFSLSGLILSCDQLTKYFVFSRLRFGGSREIIPGFLDLSYSVNNSFAFGLLQKAPSAFHDIFFIGVPVFALVLIILIFIKLRDNQMLTSVALTTILAGAVGNLMDRIKFGHVIDFVVLHIRSDFQFPRFNLADLSIVVGVVLMFINTLQQTSHHSGEAA